jgi:hypothetical protein
MEKQRISQNVQERFQQQASSELVQIGLLFEHSYKSPPPPFNTAVYARIPHVCEMPKKHIRKSLPKQYTRQFM